jgi:hypothetical protein
MRTARVHVNGVLLPDGKVLAIGAGTRKAYGGPVRTAELFDPATERWREVAAQTAPRTYHATAALLPDGRVIPAGRTTAAPATSPGSTVRRTSTAAAVPPS